MIILAILGGLLAIVLSWNYGGTEKGQATVALVMVLYFLCLVILEVSIGRF
jgi:hypothetical protein